MSSTSTQRSKGSVDNPIFSKLQKLFSEIVLSDTHSVKKRQVLFLLFIILIWSFFALILHPLQYSFGNEISSYPITMSAIIAAIPSWYLSLDVLFHVFFVFLGLFLSYQIISRYFATVYGTKPGIYVNHFLLKIIFGLPMEEPLRIDSNPILEKGNWFLKVIGGPSKVIVGAENAAIFEKSDGSVRIIGPTLNLPGSYYQLENFERLRDIVDLRNQAIQFDVQARTKDGILLILKRVNAVCSILRGSKKSTLTRPYPFNAQAIYWFVYKNPACTFDKKITEILKQEIINYIRQRSLSELIEYVGEPEIQRQTNLDKLEKAIKNREKRKFTFSMRKHSFFSHLKYQVNIRKKVQRNHKAHYDLLISEKRLINEEKTSPSSDALNYSNPLSNNVLKDLMSRAHFYGIELDWMSLGSIECASNKIQSQLQKAWQISSEYQQIYAQSEFKNIKLISEENEIESILRDIIESEKIGQKDDSNGQQNMIILPKIAKFLNNCETTYNEEPLEKRNQLKNAIQALKKLLNTNNINS